MQRRDVTRRDVIENKLLPNPANGGGLRAIILEIVKQLLDGLASRLHGFDGL
jgi:hypothetical protein